MTDPVRVRIAAVNRAGPRDAKLSARGPAPHRATELSAGLDLQAWISEPVTLSPGERALIGCGFCMELPAGTEAQVRPRSGLALKHGVTVLNAPGTIDADYRGEVSVILINFGREAFVITPGMRIAQMVVAMVAPLVVEQVSTLERSARGEGGFGSTGLQG
ncbi:MAG: dUTP diphosphatase [Pseudomonadota bacterium]